MQKMKENIDKLTYNSIFVILIVSDNKKEKEMVYSVY